MRENMKSKTPADAFAKLVQTVRKLRSKDGCSWDRAQTHESLRPYVVEEAYEVTHAINEYVQKNTTDNLKEELGDLLFQVLIHGCIAEESGTFTITDIIEDINKKMIYRHPHVFAGVDKSLVNWEKLKQDEKTQKGETGPVLENIPTEFPALLRAQKMQNKVDKLEGYLSAKDTLDALKNLTLQIETQLDTNDADTNVTAETIGEYLFLITNLARTQNIHSEDALTQKVLQFQEQYKDLR